MRKFWFSSALAASAAAGVLLLGACKAQDGADAAQQAASGGQASASAAAPAQQKAGAPQQHSDGVRRIGPAELQKMIEAGEAIAVDVRSEGSFNQGHIKGSLSIPRKELPARLSELPKDKLAVFYCAWPSEHESAGAALDIKPKGVENTAALLGGWNAWLAQNLPTGKTQ